MIYRIIILPNFGFSTNFAIIITVMQATMKFEDCRTAIFLRVKYWPEVVEINASFCNKHSLAYHAPPVKKSWRLHGISQILRTNCFPNSMNYMLNYQIISRQ